jgi:pSer/pThr/pTyr-binding forkhead associated (FHA) protein
LAEQIIIMFMSGVEDGSTVILQPNNDGTQKGNEWQLKIGRKDDNDLILKNDTFVSRYHAYLVCRDDGWWLDDIQSTNGTFLENQVDIFTDERVQGDAVPLESEQMFRVGRTWLRIQV